jgi:ABC-type sulfate/molybdate transport systems ATPase subunit
MSMPSISSNSSSRGSVYSFLGDVNLFHSRLERGRVRIGDHEVEAPEWSEAPDGAALAYVRTYEVDLAPMPNGTPAMGAIVRRVRRLGSVVRLELDREEDGKVIEAELTRGRHEELGVGKGDRVFVSPRGSEGLPRAELGRWSKSFPACILVVLLRRFRNPNAATCPGAACRQAATPRRHPWR